MKLPSDFDIFSPAVSTTKAWCIQWLANPLPERDGLGPLVLVVRELEVLPAGVEVEPLAQQVERHHHALGVPARTARAPGRRPARLARLGQLPEGEVGRVVLVLGAVDLPLAAAGPACRRATGGPAGRSPRPTGRRGRRRRRSGRRGRSRPAGRSAPPSARRSRWRGGRRSAADADALHGPPPHRLAAGGDRPRPGPPAGRGR